MQDFKTQHHIIPAHGEYYISKTGLSLELMGSIRRDCLPPVIAWSLWIETGPNGYIETVVQPITPSGVVVGEYSLINPKGIMPNAAMCSPWDIARAEEELHQRELAMERT